MKSSLYNRLLISEEVINKINLRFFINLKIIDEVNKLCKLNPKKYSVKNHIISINNYDNKIIKKYNSTIDDIINNNKYIYEFIDESFYGSNLISPFTSSRIIRDIINKLNIKTIYECNNRKVIIFSNDIINDKLINKIDSIFNFFDMITKKNNCYYLEIFLSGKKKYLNENFNVFYPDNINSGATIPGKFIYIYRKEEKIKVLFHELVHYLNLDMINYQNEFKYLYNEINLEANIINPNEAYTEVLGLLLFNIWEYKYYNVNIDINNFISNKLLIELGWSYYQICKILKYFKCYNNYNELFTNKCKFKQESNVLSYYFLKTYFLQNINLILKDLSINSLQINSSKIKSIIENTNLKDKKFSDNIDIILKSYDNFKINDKYSMRMSCTG